jgi:hypothetical protein
MTSALINEEMMVKALSCTARADNETQLATGSLMMLLDAFDRKVTRDQFVAAATAAMTCLDNIGRLCMITAVSDYVRANGGLTLVDIEVARDSATKLLTSSTGQVLKMAQLLTQLPEDGDRIQ